MKKITVYPHPRATAVLGTSAGSLNQALECWGNIIARASADNSKGFSAPEWCMIADVCNGTLWDANIDNPAVLIAANVADGHRLNGTGYRWFCDEETELARSLHRLAHGEQTKEMRQVESKVKTLVERLAALDYAHAWAAIVAVQWFWDHCELNIDPRRDPWWTLAYRKQVADAEERQQ